MTLGVRADRGPGRGRVRVAVAALTGGLFLAALDQNAPQRLDGALPTIRPGDHARVARRRRRWRAAALGTLAMAATVGLSLQRRRPS